METFLSDVRYSLRRLAAARWFTAAAVFTLALGIGANGAVFTFVNAVLLRGLPFDDPDRIVSVFPENQRGQQVAMSYPDFEDLRDQSRSFDELAVSLNATVNISEDEILPERLSGVYVSSGFFDMIGESPILGRNFTEEDNQEGAEPVVLLGHSVWQTRYGGDPDIIGRTVRANSLIATVVGVMAPGMQFPNNNDIWIPHQNLPPETQVNDRSVGNFSVMGRLRPGVSIDSAREEVALIGRRLVEAYPGEGREWTIRLMSFQERINGPEIRTIFLSLMGAVAFVLLIACANVANLLLARATLRTREIAVRVSLGATRSRIVRQLIVESGILSILAGVVGFAFAYFGIRWFDANTQDVGKPYWMEFTLDANVYLFIVAVCAGTVLLSGLAPALQVSRTDVNEVLKDGGRSGSSGLRSRRWAGALAVGQVILTLILLSGATFMMRSFVKLYTLNSGFDTADLLTMQIYMPLTQYPEAGPRQQFYEEFDRELASIPELEATAFASSFPLMGGGGAPLQVEGEDPIEDDLRPIVTSLTVGPGYFETLDIPLLQGRAFNEADGGEGSETAVVNQRFADLYLGGSALGRRVKLGGAAATADEPWFTVVGVVPNIRQRDPQDLQPDPIVYQPLRANPGRVMGLMLRTRGDPTASIEAVRSAVRSVDPDLPLYGIMTMEDRLAEQRWAFRVFGSMFSLFAFIALVLSAVGLYSLTAQSVAQRTTEFGIRMSLGATPREIARLAVNRATRHLAIALPIGILGAIGVGRLLSSLLVQMTPTDPVTLVTVVGILTTVVVLACLQPARRASRLDPVEALRLGG